MLLSSIYFDPETTRVRNERGLTAFEVAVGEEAPSKAGTLPELLATIEEGTFSGPQRLEAMELFTRFRQREDFPEQWKKTLERVSLNGKYDMGSIELVVARAEQDWAVRRDQARRVSLDVVTSDCIKRDFAALVLRGRPMPDAAAFAAEIELRGMRHFDTTGVVALVRMVVDTAPGRTVALNFYIPRFMDEQGEGFLLDLRNEPVLRPRSAKVRMLGFYGILPGDDGSPPRLVRRQQGGRVGPREP